MITIRQGNTVIIKCTVLTNGKEISLEGRDIKILINAPAVWQEIKNLYVKENIVTFKFEGKDQKNTGRCDIILYENYRKENQMVADVCNVFTIVGKNCYVTPCENNTINGVYRKPLSIDSLTITAIEVIGDYNENFNKDFTI